MDATDFRANAPLAPLTTWGIGGPAGFLAEPNDFDSLDRALRFAVRERFEVVAIGGGSNLLVSDAGFDGLVVRYAADARELRAGTDETRLWVEAGARLSSVARWSSRLGWAGMEWAEGIPGTIGGAVCGNAGAYGGEMAEIIESVEERTGDGARRTLTAAQAGFAYRSSRWKSIPPTEGFVVAATLRLRRGDPVALEERLRTIARERKSKTPAGSSTGSVFQNPPGESAGRLLEQAEMKGASEGGAVISTAHGNYIVNRGGATASDVLALIRRARAAVLARSGILLTPEVRFIGFSRDEIADLVVS
mgnify:CR=1 FL=1